uniref:Uncharacterized protein n=1 Tax=Anguilla anguilla TaxID=7936 RepID=A0A0E9WQZ3_ANGAN
MACSFQCSLYCSIVKYSADTLLSLLKNVPAKLALLAYASLHCCLNRTSMVGSTLVTVDICSLI